MSPDVMNSEKNATDNDAALWMIYGANGYTGRRIAREAVTRGLHPILAGRRREQIEPLAEELGCPRRVFALDDPQQLARELEAVRLVLHCAGPFSATALPMIEAALAARCHYLDITGEIDVIEAAHDRHERAVAAQISLIPAVGFDVVPTDCLAAMLADELPDATQLQLAFFSRSPLSPGTAKTVAENQHRGGFVRRDGQIVNVPSAWKTMDIPFRSGTRPGVTIPWGDVASAYYTTGIPNIEVYLGGDAAQIRWMRRLRPLYGLMGWPPVAKTVRWLIQRRVHGPNQQQWEKYGSSLWGRVSNDSAEAVEATLETLGGYPLTVETSIAAALRTLAGEAPIGFCTPAKAFGKNFILEMPGTDVEIHRVESSDATTGSPAT